MASWSLSVSSWRLEGNVFEAIVTEAVTAAEGKSLALSFMNALQTSCSLIVRFSCLCKVILQGNQMS